MAGASIHGDVFKCQRQSVTAAISAGIYGDLDVWPYLEQLENVFPSGVCDYRLADAGRPKDLLPMFTLVSEQEISQSREKSPKAKVVLESTASSDAKPITLSRLDTPAETELRD